MENRRRNRAQYERKEINRFMKTIREVMGVMSIAALCGFGAGCAKKPAAAIPPVPNSVQASAPAPTRTPERARPTASTPTPTQETAKSRYPDEKTRARIDELLARIQDAYFDYDRHNLRPDALTTLESDSRELAEIVRQYPDFKMKVEGYCDERGSAEYNLALGDKRAESARDYLVAQGIPKDQLVLTSYGKENQVCTEHTEECWQKNRRAHIVAMARP
jgi:peptidoglycan-associated lipoprotein